jgi:general secretion pathway protein K
MSMHEIVQWPNGRQQGVAVVTALLLTALAVTIVTGLFWQQQVQLRLVENQQTRLRQQWLMRDLMDWARLMLIEDDRTSTVDYENEAWTRPLAAQPQVDPSDARPAVLSGVISDAQSRFNITNLSEGGTINLNETAVFERLLNNLRLNGQLARATADSLAALQRTDTGDIDTARMRLWQLDDLSLVSGFTPEIVGKLREFVVVLPRATQINVNTAPAQVLAALFPAMSTSDAASLVADRRRAYFRDAADFTQRLQVRNLPAPRVQIGFGSRFFLARGKVVIGDGELQTESLIERNAGQTKVLWSREENPWER